MGYSHPVAGERLAMLWELPGHLVDVIRNHHNPEEAETNPELVHLVYLADLMMSRFRVINELERIDTGGLVTSMRRVGLKKEDLPKLVDAIPWTMFNEQHEEDESIR
jgi:hypothetical protein